jgi:hypothetical protein
MKLTITVDDGNGNNAARAMDISPTTQPQTPADTPDVSAGPAPSAPGGGIAQPPAAEAGGAVPALAAGETEPISAGPAPSDT